MMASGDMVFELLTAIWRVGKNEKNQRSGGCGKVAGADHTLEVSAMYEPIAEDKGVALVVHSPHELSTHGDRDLLIEAVANLVENAIKFTPAGGQVEIELLAGDGDTILRAYATRTGIS